MSLSHELDKDEEGQIYLVVHSGSRNLGLQVAEHYQKEAYNALKSNASQSKALIKQLKEEGRDQEISEALKGLKPAAIDKALAYCEGGLLDDYLNDMRIVQNYADLNRQAIIDEIAREMKFKIDSQFTTVHNYIELDTMILRKGAISAKEGERMLIPMNMRDGSLICIGKGNPDWNYSAPHGAGRLMSRREAKGSIKLSAFVESMKGVYSTSVNKTTIDESPFAYKPMNEIVSNIEETAKIERVLKPLYNFKAAE